MLILNKMYSYFIMKVLNKTKKQTKINMKKSRKNNKRKNRKSRKGGKGCGCENKSLAEILKMNGGNNLADTKYYYGVNNQENYKLPESSSMHGGKKKRKSLKKMKGGNLLGRAYDNFFLNFPDTKGVNHAGAIANGDTIKSSAPYEHLKVETNQNPIA